MGFAIELEQAGSVGIITPKEDSVPFRGALPYLSNFQLLNLKIIFGY